MTSKSERKRGAPRGNTNARKKRGYHSHAIRLSFDGEMLDEYFASQGYLPKEEDVEDLLKLMGYQLFNEHFKRAIEHSDAVML